MTKSEDNREKLQALQLFKDTHLTKIELMANATTIDSALQFIKSKQQAQHKKRLADDDDDISTSLSNPITQAGRQSVF
jgi:hypothetical protein